MKNLNRREFLNLVAGSAAALVMPAGGCESQFTRSKSTIAKRPNIIFILADDLGYGDLGCYGQEKIKTPNLDRMAAEGMRFTQHYAGSTVCAPSRCALMTSLHTGHCWVRGNKHVPLRPSDVTIAELLKQAGYVTGITGKWGLGEPETTGIPNKQGFDQWFGYLNQHNAHFYYQPFLWKNKQLVVLEGNKDGQRRQYTHDLFTDFALDFIRTNKDKPFFLYLAYTIPHAELLVPDDSLRQYIGKFPERPYEKRRPGDYNSQATPKAAFAAMITRMDRDIGQIFSLLKKLGIDDNTFVMFSSDNGPHKEGGADPEFFGSNGSLRGIKRDLYEGGIRVPTIARWPGKIKPGAVSDHVSGFWDFLPTCAELAGIKVPDNIDGISMVPTLLGRYDKQKNHKFLYWEFHEQGGKQAVRIGNFKGVRLNVHKNPTGPIELYNLKNDLGEKNNIADQHPGIIAKIKKIMKSARTESSHWPIKRKSARGNKK
jgi:arylsulfatase A